MHDRRARHQHHRPSRRVSRPRSAGIRHESWCDRGVIPADGTSFARQPGRARPSGARSEAARSDGARSDGARSDGAQDARGQGQRGTGGREPVGRALAGRDIAGLVFAGEMYGVQLDQLAAILGVSDRQARAAAARWVAQGAAESARLGPGASWIWLTRAGLASCGLRYTAAAPALSRLAHIRAVTAVRLALESAGSYAAAGAYWRGERRLRARMGGRVGARAHIPDGEVHWPDSPSGGPPVPWAGECWAIEAELTPKTVRRTSEIMRDLLTRTADLGAPAAEARLAGRPPWYARVLYLCGPAAASTVARARDELGGQGARIEIRALPAGSYLPLARDGG